LNGALVFPACLISGTGKLVKLFIETVLVFNLYFQHNMNQSTGKASTPFERALNFGLASILKFCIYFVFAHEFCL
jgi:hypothetical protein